MSIINNANPGSDLSLVCLVDRELQARKSLPVELNKFVTELRPESLSISENAAGKLPQTISFWVEQGLWIIDRDKSEITLDPKSKKVNLEKRLISCIFRNCEDLTGNSVEPFLRVIAGLICADKFNPIFGDRLEHQGFAYSASASLPSRFQINQSNEVLPFLEYARFLGFVEQIAEKLYIVDPTRAIGFFLSEVFGSEREIPVKEFRVRIASYIPVLDEGIVNSWIKDQLTTAQYIQHGSMTISNTVSFALTRLSARKVLRLRPGGDDPNACDYYSLATGRREDISHVEWLGATQ